MLKLCKKHLWLLLAAVIAVQLCLAACTPPDPEQPTPPSTVCTLDQIKLGEQSLPEFNSATLTYSVVLPYNAVAAPEITYTLTDPNSTATLTNPTGVPGEARIRVLAEDGFTAKTYVITFSLDTPPASVGYVYEGTPTVAPYYAKNEDGSQVTNPDGSPILDTNGDERVSFDNLFFAIHFAAAAGTTSNRTSVVDSNGTVVFSRSSQSTFFMYDGSNYVGSATSSEALAWGLRRERSYIVNGRGSAYIQLGIKMMPGSTTETPPYELNAGAYNYMFSKHGEMTGGSWSKDGYGYMSCYVRLSEAIYKPAKDNDKGWNAYIFINHNGGYNIDLGLIGNLFPAENVVRWRLVRNCFNEDEHTDSDPKFKVWHSEIVTEMTYNASLDAYTGADDLFFEVTADTDGWLLKITNLRNNNIYTIDESHPGFHENSTQYFRFLLAASYCPVRGDMWNARCGAVLENVVFDHVRIARYNADKNYPESAMEDFYPNEPNLRYGFAQGADCADFEFGTRSSSGTYKSGKTYAAGDKYLVFSTYYDGRNDQ